MARAVGYEVSASAKRGVTRYYVDCLLYSLTDMRVQTMWCDKLHGNAIRIAAAIGVFACCFQSEQWALAVDMESIERAWKNRESEMHSIKVQWRESRVNRPFDEDGHLSQNETAQAVPLLTMYIDGGKVRFDDVLVNAAEEDPNKATIAAFNGKEARNLSPDHEHPWGIIYEYDRFSCSGRMSAWPLLLLYRGLHAKLLDMTLDVFSKSEPRKDDNGNVVLTAATPRDSRLSSAVWELTLDPAAAFAPIKLTGSHNNAPSFDLRLDVSRNSDGVIVPKSWSVSFVTDRGVLLQAVRAVVIACDVNPFIDGALFDLEFPNGTVVDDLRPRSTGGRERQFIVVDDTEREVHLDELIRGATYEDLVASKPGEAGLVVAQPNGGRQLLLYLNIGIVILLAIVLAYRHLRRRAFRAAVC